MVHDPFQPQVPEEDPRPAAVEEFNDELTSLLQGFGLSGSLPVRSAFLTLIEHQETQAIQRLIGAGCEEQVLEVAGKVNDLFLRMQEKMGQKMVNLRDYFDGKQFEILQDIYTQAAADPKQGPPATKLFKQLEMWAEGIHARAEAIGAPVDLGYLAAVLEAVFSKNAE